MPTLGEREIVHEVLFSQTAKEVSQCRAVSEKVRPQYNGYPHDLFATPNLGL